MLYVNELEFVFFDIGFLEKYVCLRHNYEGFRKLFNHLNAAVDSQNTCEHERRQNEFR